MTAQQQLTKRELARIRQQRRRQKNPESERKRQTLHAFVYDAVQPISSFFRGKHQTVAILGKQQLVAILGFSTKYSSPATPSSSITEASAVLKFLPKTWGKVAGTTLWARRIPKKREGSWWCYWTKVYWGFTIPASVKCNSSVQWCDVLWSVHLPGMERRTRLAVRVPPQKLKDFLPDLIQRMQDTHGVIISPKIIVPHQDLSETTGSENEQLYIFKEYRPNSSPWGEAITISDEYIPEIF